MEHFTLKLKDIKKIGTHTSHFTFVRTDDKELEFVPGQFISLFIDQDGTLKRRNYSLANPPGQKELEFSCSYVPGGIASEVLFNLQPGDELPSRGPAGILVLPEQKFDKYFFFATGTGITPVCSMLPLISDILQDSNKEFNLIFGARKLEDILYQDMFEEFASKHPNFKWSVCLSQEEGKLDKPYLFKGRVQSKMPELGITRDHIVFLCGNPHMVDEVFVNLTEQGMPSKLIKREKYISPK